MSRVLAVVVALSFCACALDDVALDDESQPIVGGSSALGFPAVVVIGGCTGTVIAPRVVLTAAHCRIVPGDSARVVNIDQTLSEHQVIAVHNHRLFNDTGMVAPADVAVAHLSSDPMVEPHPFPVDPLEGLNGKEIVSVGFGANNSDDFSGFGTKRTARFLLDFANEELIGGEGTVGEAICFGDSGGPAFLEQDGELLVVGVASRTQGCISDSGWTRVDTYAPGFIVPALDSFEGPCAFDGTCVTDGCRTPDPDCAPCGLDGICSSGCDVVDLDCPPKLPFGSSCTVDDDCESLQCLENPNTGEPICVNSCSATELCPSQADCLVRSEGSVCIPKSLEPTDDGGCGCSSTSGGSSALAMLVLLVLGGWHRHRFTPRAS